MDAKFIRAMLEVCDTKEEIDFVFEDSNVESFEKRCNYLKENGVEYFDLPKDFKSQYEVLKMMYIQPTSKDFRKKSVAGKLLREVVERYF
jgi:hypothetical protein